MYAKHKLAIAALFLLVFSICYMENIAASLELLNSMMTFLSVVFGFISISISLVFSSKRIGSLYREIDPIKKSQRKVHTITAYYSCSMYLVILGIVVTLISAILIDNSCKFQDVALVQCGAKLMSWISIGGVFCAIFLAFLTTKLMLVGLVIEGKLRSASD